MDWKKLVIFMSYILLAVIGVNRSLSDTDVYHKVISPRKGSLEPPPNPHYSRCPFPPIKCPQE